MISEQRYLIAQYARDLRRMESRNIGIILWADGRADAKFLGDSDASEFVDDLEVYKRWVAFWTKLAYGSEITLPREQSVSKVDPRFLDAIFQTQKGNYLLFDAGFVSDEITSADVPSAVSFLFDDLVAARKAATEEPADTLEAVADRVIGQAGISARDDFHFRYRIPCKVFGVEQDLVFNYAISGESTKAVFQRVPLKQQSVNSTALMFHAMLEMHKIAGKKRCAALVDVADEQRDQPSVIKSLRMLRRVSEVVDMSDRAKAIERVKDIADAA